MFINNKITKKYIYIFLFFLSVPGADHEKSASTKKTDVSKKLHVDVNLANHGVPRHLNTSGVEG